MMKKIPTIYVRDPEDMSKLTDEQHPDCDWVFKGEGVPTLKLDGTCCKIEGGVLFKRREVRKGKPIPDDFIEEDYDETTGKRFGWVMTYPENPEDRYYYEVFEEMDLPPDGTYELLGPKVQGNPEGHDKHVLLAHGSIPLDITLDSRQALIDQLKVLNIEGVVWHHPDGRKAKIKKKDFGLARKLT